jgi:ABC-2 type transport system permease protein/lipopolysaccharide transport system permease protein
MAQAGQVDRDDEAGPPADLLFRRRVRPGPMLRELVAHRTLVSTLAERELRARYKQTRMGFAWALITPFLLMVVFTVFFRRAVRVDTGDVPYPLFSYIGLLPWTLFSTALSKGAVSITSNMPLLNKVYCPREVFPLAAIAVAAVDTAIAVSILGVLFVIYGFAPEATSVWVPLLLLIQVAFTVGITLVLSALVVYVRDLRQVLPMLLQLALFATPVAYGIDFISEGFRPLYSVLNPLVPIIDGYRRAVLLGQAPDLELLALAAGPAAIWLVGGYLLFKRLETGFADIA